MKVSNEDGNDVLRIYILNFTIYREKRKNQIVTKFI